MISTVMYDPKGFALEIFQSRHAAHPNETWEEACDRVAVHIANAEDGAARTIWRDKFKVMLQKNLFMPGGRIWYGSGRLRGQLLNCFVIGTSDSREGWGKTVSDSIIISGTGGGVGLNCSPIRPAGSPVRGTGGTATGAVSLMEIINAAGDVIKAGGGRRTALMLCLDISHGDILEFLNKKLDLGKLNNANVSVVFDEDPEEFFKLVRAGADFPLTFQGKQVGSIPAAELWMKIVKNAIKMGEPGILNMHLANKMSNISYHKKITSTNPCGEIGLTSAEACVLGHIVLPRFVNETGTNINWDALRETVACSIRFLDNVLSVNSFPLPETAEVCASLRRLGLGITGLHHLLLELGMKYNSAIGLEFVDKLMKFIKNCSYEASADLAAERGSFTLYDEDKVLKSSFVKNLKPSIREKIRHCGLRNCALNTIAPCGTISIICGVSSGIEPIFAPAYERRYKKNDEPAMEIVVDPLFKKFASEGRSLEHFQGSYDLSMRDHFEMQRTCQLHIDNAISKTVQIPQGTSCEELSELYMEFLPDLKGVTVYPEGSRENQPLTPLSLEEAMFHINADAIAAGNDNCKSGVCDL